MKGMLSAGKSGRVLTGDARAITRCPRVGGEDEGTSDKGTGESRARDGRGEVIGANRSRTDRARGRGRAWNREMRVETSGRTCRGGALDADLRTSGIVGYLDGSGGRLPCNGRIILKIMSLAVSTEIK